MRLLTAGEIGGGLLLERKRYRSGPRPSLPGYRGKSWHTDLHDLGSSSRLILFTSISPAATALHFGMALSLLAMKHRVHRGRDEIGGVYLPSQLENTLQLLYVIVNIVEGGGRALPTLTSLG